MDAFLRSVVVLLLVALPCCSRSQQTADRPPGEADEEGPIEGESDPSPAPEPGPTDGPTGSRPGDADTMVVRILETGPSGSGACVQRSYRVERTDAQGTAPFWAHFEHCQGSPPAGFDGAGLVVGETYRLRLRRVSGGNFDGEPMIVGVGVP
jgi:hypothetical protein